ncbi:MAG: hypothetical protein ACHP7M_12305 [Burkholderiales bacterium]
MSFPRTTLFGAASLFAALFTIPSWANDGTPDPTFGVNGVAYITPDDVEARELRPYAATVLPDGKLLVAGVRDKYNPAVPFEPELRGMLARFNADGSVDTTFGNTSIPGVEVLPDLNANARMQTIEAMQRMADGSIIVAGSAFVNVPLKGFVVKLDANGVMDTAFGAGGVVLLPQMYAHALAIDSQGRIVVAGEKSISAISHSAVVRLDASGAPDTTFGAAGDGTVVIDWDGVAGQGGYLGTLGITSADRILVGGSYEVYGAGMGADFAIARLDASGALDPAFGGTGWRVFHRTDIAPSTNINGIDRLLPTAAGGAVFAGHYNDDITGINVVLGRIAGDGTTDAGFGAAASPGYQPIDIVPNAWTRYPTGIAQQADGKLVVSVSYSTTDKEGFLAFRTSDAGALDVSFADAGVLIADLAPNGVFSDAAALALDAAERPILAGTSERSTSSPLYDLTALRLTHDSTPADRIFANGFDGTPPFPSSFTGR